MRFNIQFKSNKNFFIPFNYNYIISSILYNKIIDPDLSKRLHSEKLFKFFNFSQIYIPKPKINNKGLISKDGRFSLIVSSANDYLIKSMIQSYVDEPSIIFINDEVNVSGIKLLPPKNFSNKEEFKTISPVMTTTKKLVDGELKIWDLPPGDKFFNNLEANLLRKYSMFNKLDCTNKNIKISSRMRNVKSKRINIKKGDIDNHHVAYLMDIIIEGDSKLIEFAYDVGLGEKNSLGFGLLELLR